jgi:hypothetical protein
LAVALETVLVRVRAALTEQVLGNGEARGPAKVVHQRVNSGYRDKSCIVASTYLVTERVEQQSAYLNRVRGPKAEDFEVSTVLKVAAAPL